jgi:4-hydroxybenzoate polyprenyltransferase
MIYAHAFPRSGSATAFMKAYVVTMRPYLLFVSGITGIAGISLVDAPETVRIVLVGAASFLSYGFGQALTDCFQIDTDSLSSPYRPLTQGLISRGSVLITSLVGLTGCVAIFSFYHPLNLVLGAGAAVGLATYTPMKRLWYAGPFYNAWIVVVLCLMAFLASGGEIARLPLTVMLGLAGAVFFGYANFVLTGYFKDISADRATGYRTLPVVHGRRISARVSDLLALCAVGSALIASRRMSSSQPLLPGMLLLGAGIVFSAVAQWRLRSVSEDRTAHRAIAPVLDGYILMLSGLASLQHPAWSAGLLLYSMLYRVVLKIRPAQDQL